MIPHRIQQKSTNYALYSFLWGLIIAVAIVAPIIYYDNGYFLYYGDFNVQQIPFYRLAHDSILSGNTGWSRLTDLGANFIGSYSFYLLGSPFFWLTMILPSQLVPYSMGILLTLKLACCSLSGYIYLRRYVSDKRYAMIGGLLYAFSSYSIYNIFFFHFHEAMIIFPLLLAAVDEFHSTGRKGVVLIAVFAAATVNYYFFFGQALFVAIYYVLKLICGSYRFRIKEFLSLAAECILGVLLSAFLLLPSIAAITGNYRVSEFVNGWGVLIYTYAKRYVQIIVSLLFPGDIPAKNNFTASAGAKWASVAAYIPMFSLTFVIAYIRTKKRAFNKRLLILLAVMALVPVLNSAFQALNSSYYARWFYMPTLIFALVTARSLDDIKAAEFKKGFFPTLIITAALTLLIGLTPEKTADDSKQEKIKLGLESMPTVFWAFAGVSLVGLLITLLLWLLYKKKPKLFFRGTAIALTLFIICYSELYLWVGKMNTDTSDDFMLTYALNYGEDVTLDDVHDVRSDFYETCDNLPMYWQVPTIQAFHSIVPASVMDFYNEIGVQRDVGSRPSIGFYGLRAFLSVKYLFAKSDSDYGKDNAKTMPHFDYLREENGFKIYENKAYIPMGFTYDKFITKEEFRDLSNNSKHLALLKAMVLTQDQMKKYSDITGYTDGMYLNLNFTHNDNDPQNKPHPIYEGFDSITAGFAYDSEEYYKDAKNLRENSCSYFAYDNEGFTAVYDNKGDDDLLFFSVPYDEGWTAYVNGEQVDIEKVNIGFMAIKAEGHTENHITFRYRTPMQKEGIIVSCAAFVCALIYLIINRGFRARRRLRRTYRIKAGTNLEGK